MNDEAALLAAIRANPADDTTRLVYADWLDEHDRGERAELIRVQIELARPVPPEPSSLEVNLCSSGEHARRVEEYRAARVRRAELDRRERELLTTVKLPVPPGWAVGVGLGLWARGARGDLFLRRGMIERAVCRGETWVADGDAILAEHPVERVRLTSVPRTEGDEDGIGLKGDPLQRRFAPAEVRAVRRANDPGTAAGALVPLLRLRYGERVTFDLTGAGGA
ncbi:MAG: TIGR02996 domain-containing protein [Planctomycetes bacterium]|nr:TIGR02996 domain-containing protein [Planctomycetota bacterium]